MATREMEEWTVINQIAEEFLDEEDDEEDDNIQTASPAPTRMGDEASSSIDEDDGVFSLDVVALEWLQKQQQPAVTTTRPHRARSPSLAPDVTDYLRTWLLSARHIDPPYPTQTEQQQILDDTGITRQQFHTWFIKNRKRQVRWSLLNNRTTGTEFTTTDRSTE